MGDSALPFADAARSLLRSSVLDSVRSLLMERDWARISVAEVAKVTGVSRQTIYNEFMSRTGLAQAYAQRVIDNFVTGISHLAAGPDIDIQRALEEGFLTFFADLARDPVIQSAREGEITGDVARLLTTDGAGLIEHACDRLTTVYHGAFPNTPIEDVRALAFTVVQVANSYILRPPTDAQKAAHDHSRVFAMAVGGYLRERDISAPVV